MDSLCRGRGINAQVQLRSLVLLTSLLSFARPLSKLFSFREEALRILVPIIRLLHIFLKKVNAGNRISNSRSTHLDHLLEDGFEVLGTAEHERIHSKAQLALWSARAMAHRGHQYREGPFRLPQILEGVVVNSCLLDVIFNAVFVRHDVGHVCSEFSMKEAEDICDTNLIGDSVNLCLDTKLCSCTSTLRRAVSSSYSHALEDSNHGHRSRFSNVIETPSRIFSSFRRGWTHKVRKWRAPGRGIRSKTDTWLFWPFR